MLPTKTVFLHGQFSLAKLVYPPLKWEQTRKLYISLIHGIVEEFIGFQRKWVMKKRQKFVIKMKSICWQVRFVSDVIGQNGANEPKLLRLMSRLALDSFESKGR